jgi:hypothetical protein
MSKLEKTAERLSKTSYDDVLDDAVMGCLLESTVWEVMPELGLDPESKPDRRLFAQAIDLALQS